MIYYNEFDFREEWPEEIKNNLYLITIGARFEQSDLLCKMIRERTESKFIYFGCWWPEVIYDQVYEIHCCEATGNNSLLFLCVNNREIM